MFKKIKLSWLLWGLFTLALSAYLGYRIASNDKTVFLPGETTHGHYQIEMACGACHKDPFGGGEVLQDACMNCHGAELKEADDKHPRSKFTDPRNADRLQKIDALHCVTCHTEHKPEITSKMGVTVPQDVCMHCHVDIADDRPSHKGMEFTTCSSSGCHNYHDNRALYEDFLLKHLHEEDVLKEKKVLQRNLVANLQLLNDYPLDEFPVKVFSKDEQDAPVQLSTDTKIVDEWHQSAHAQAGVNCSACHYVMPTAGSAKTWIEKPDHKVCMTCHKQEHEDYLKSKHGMRLAQDLSPMTPAQAKIKMHPDAANQELGCTSCHSDHRFNTQQAEITACMNCHADEHTKAYKQSPHYKYWKLDQEQKVESGTGVSCATCHLPRHEQKAGGKIITRVLHNQNDNLRPNEKMIRGVCMNCHGLGFSIDALADEKLIKNNFNGMPTNHIPSLDMVKQRQQSRLGKGKEGS